MSYSYRHARLSGSKKKIKIIKNVSMHTNMKYLCDLFILLNIYFIGFYLQKPPRLRFDFTWIFLENDVQTPPPQK